MRGRLIAILIIIPFVLWLVVVSGSGFVSRSVVTIFALVVILGLVKLWKSELD